jgi:hypothetical protein
MMTEEKIIFFHFFLKKKIKKYYITLNSTNINNIFLYL